jgi:SIR2-like domain
MSDLLDRHCQVVARRLGEGKVIPFLGAGANLCGRPRGGSWREGGYLPSGQELAAHLAETYAYPGPDDSDLLRVAQYVDLTAGDAALFDELHEIFGGAYLPNALHRLLAELPGRMRAQRQEVCGQLVITTNYDDAVEHAFRDAGEELDVVYYAASPNEAGRFVHVRPDGEHVEIPGHTDYRAFALEHRSILFKIHGAVDRSDFEGDSYVITEDHYIDYLARESIARLIPTYLMARMRTSHFLFLGYGMRDWNLRVILRSIWAEQSRQFASWAIQRDSTEIDRRFWERHRVEILDRSLEDWVEAMRSHL